MSHLSPSLILIVIIGYFFVLLVISHFTSGKGDNQTFFTANKNSHWLLVAIGMIGASLSGVTFVSLPGLVGKASGQNFNFSYMQMVFGYLVGYAFIALVLMPIYYKYNLTSIYTYLEKRLGFFAYKTGAAYFLLSRILGASLRLYLVAMVMDNFVTGPMGIPFVLTVIIAIALIWVYTFKGGIKTIVITDTFQTISMLAAVILTIYAIVSAMNINLSEAWGLLSDKGYTQIFYFENGLSDDNNFFKQFVSGALIAMVMTGMDQDMMQKNLTCRTLKEAQKNIFTFSIILIFANLLFLTLGGLLYIYAANLGLEIPQSKDQLYPMIALNYLSPAIGIFFILGLIAAAYSSADSALTSLTTSFCIDFLDIQKKDKFKNPKFVRLLVHVGFSVLLLIIILGVKAYNDDSIINKVFQVASYTYGPILGLFIFSIFTNRTIKNGYWMIPFTKMTIKNDFWIIPICILAPLLCYKIDVISPEQFNFKWGYLILLLNGLITFLGLLIISKRSIDGK